jgi:hypothetical protein
MSVREPKDDPWNGKGYQGPHRLRTNEREWFMTTKDRDTAVGVFTDFTHAEQAIEELRSSGFASDQIGFVADDPAKMEAPPVESGTRAGRGAVVGADVGGVLGAALGLTVAAVVVPVVGPVIVGGLLGGALIGGASGGILGALIGLNLPEDEARHCEQQFHSGRSLVTVKAGDRYEEAVAILSRVAERPEQHHTRHRTYDLLSQSGPGDGGGSVFVPQP